MCIFDFEDFTINLYAWNTLYMYMLMFVIKLGSIRLMEEMKDFHDTHSNLSQWLSAKDRMMAALGPISSDSRMVQTQVQQVRSQTCIVTNKQAIFKELPF